MKFAVLAAATAAAFVAVSPAAAINYSSLVVLNPTTGVAAIGQTHGGLFEPNGTAFSDTYTFATTLNGVAAAAAVSITVSSVPDYLTLTTATLNGTTVSFTSTLTGGMRTYLATVMAPTLVLPSFNTLVVSGSVTGNGGTYNGNVSVAAAVPETATWGLMVLGFGAIGGALRTSRRKVVFA